MNLSKAKARKMLKAIYDMACEAGMTESLRDGSEVLSANYNKIRDLAITNDWVSADWVVELTRGEGGLLNKDSEWMDVVGTAAKMFMIQLEDDDDE